MLSGKRRGVLSIAVLLSFLVASEFGGSAGDFEVWLVDQSNSFGKTYGGTIYVYEGEHLNGAAANFAQPISVIDLGGTTAGLCQAQTGANPVRPHMLFFNSTRSHAILSFVVSGHVVVFNAATRSPVACVRTSLGFGGARQAHAAIPAPDDSYILVANQNGKLLERIDSNYATNTFTLNAGATINLATCTTPNGNPCESAAVRPNNIPICPLVDSSGKLGFVTLGGGGLFVVNPTTTPMSIVGEYDRQTVHGNGCGGLQASGSMYVNSGAGTVAVNLSEFDLYRFPLSGYAASNAVNTPAPVVVFSDDTVPPAHERDSHGTVATKHDKYVWAFDRAMSVAEVFATSNNAHLGTIDLQTPLAEDPTPDLSDISPSGNRIFVSLRGPNPLSGSPHVATGSTPGLGVIQVTQNGKSGTLKSIVRITNIDTDGLERADAHGIRVRLK